MGKGDPDVCEEGYELLGEPTPNPSSYHDVLVVVEAAGVWLPGNDGAYKDTPAAGYLGPRGACSCRDRRASRSRRPAIALKDDTLSAWPQP